MSLYSADAVSVDEHFARFGSKSYAIDKTNSVDVRWKPMDNPNNWGTAAVVAFLLLLVGVMELQAVVVVFGLIAAGVAYWYWSRRHLKIYSLYLMTSSAEAQAFTTYDGDAIERLRTAIEKAMTSGRRVVAE